MRRALSINWLDIISSKTNLDRLFFAVRDIQIALKRTTLNLTTGGSTFHFKLRDLLLAKSPKSKVQQEQTTRFSSFFKSRFYRLNTDKTSWIFIWTTTTNITHFSVSMSLSAAKHTYFLKQKKRGMINFVYCFDQGVVFILTTFEATLIESGIFNSFFCPGKVTINLKYFLKSFLFDIFILMIHKLWRTVNCYCKVKQEVSILLKLTRKMPCQGRLQRIETIETMRLED